MDELEQRVRDFVHDHVSWLRLDMASDTDVVGSGLYGDDVWEMVDEFAERFAVRMDGFRWYHHSGPEGCNPFWLVFRPRWARAVHVPIRLSDLVESARRGVWSVQYPDGEGVHNT